MILQKCLKFNDPNGFLHRFAVVALSPGIARTGIGFALATAIARAATNNNAVAAVNACALHNTGLA